MSRVALTRKPNARIMIRDLKNGTTVFVSYSEVLDWSVRIIIDAPSHVEIQREELVNIPKKEEL